MQHHKGGNNSDAGAVGPVFNHVAQAPLGPKQVRILLHQALTAKVMIIKTFIGRFIVPIIEVQNNEFMGNDILMV